MSTPKTPVTESALLGRINRKLARSYKSDRDVYELEVIKKCRRDSRWHNDLGDFYSVDVVRNFIMGQHIDLEEWGREMGVLRAGEELQS